MVLVHTQKIGIQSEKPTWTKALEFTQFACPCGTDPRLLSGEQRTSHFKLVTSVDDPSRDMLGSEWLLQIGSNGPALLLKDDRGSSPDSLCLVEFSMTQVKAPRRESGPRHDP